MSESDYIEVSQKATLFIHMAATTNFNENLRLSIELNVLGVCELTFSICEMKYPSHPHFSVTSNARFGSPN
jgi:hypothetical protein